MSSEVVKASPMNKAAPDAAPCRLVAVVVTHNRLLEVQTTLSRLLDSPPDELAAVVVFENASTDGTESYLSALETQDARVDVLRSKVNVGGAGGFEQGMRHAVTTYEPDWLVVMDDDGRPDTGTLSRFHERDRSGAHGWGAACYYPNNGEICDINRPSINPFWNRSALRRTLLGEGRNGFHLGAEAYASKEVRDIDGASFVGLFISRAGIALAGYPDGELFIYGDDVLYTLKMRALGGRILFDPALRFEHNFSSHSKDLQRFNPLWKSYYHHRNLLMVYRLCAGVWFVLVLPTAAIKWLLKARHYKGQRLRYAMLVLRALRDGVLSRKGVHHEAVLRWSREQKH